MAQRVTGDIDPDQFYQKGESFYFAAVVLCARSKKEMGPATFAIITCMAFACEVYLKVLALIENDEQPLDTHHLVNLYLDLKLSTRREIEKAWNKAHLATFKQHRINAATNPNWPPGIKVPKSFAEALQWSAKAFIDWRYPSSTLQGFYMMGLPAILRDLILVRMPEWKPIVGESLTVLNPHPDFIKPQDDDAPLPIVGFILNRQSAAFDFKPKRSTNPKDGRADK